MIIALGHQPVPRHGLLLRPAARACNANEWENNIDDLAEARSSSRTSTAFSLGGPIQQQQGVLLHQPPVSCAPSRAQTVTRTVYTAGRAQRASGATSIGGRNQPAGVAGASVDANGNVVPGSTRHLQHRRQRPAAARHRPRRSAASIGLTPLPNNFTVGDGLNTAGYTFSPLEDEKQHDFVDEGRPRLQPAATTPSPASRRASRTRSATDGQRRPAALPRPAVPRRHASAIPGTWRRTGAGTRRRTWSTSSSSAGNHFTFDFVTPDRATRADARRSPVGAHHDPGDFAPRQPAHAQHAADRQQHELHTAARTASSPASISASAARGHPRLGQRRQRDADRQLQHARQHGRCRRRSTCPRTSSRPTIGRARVEHQLPARPRRPVTQGFVSTGDAYAPGGTPFVFDARYPRVRPLHPGQLEAALEPDDRPRPALGS